MNGFEGTPNEASGGVESKVILEALETMVEELDPEGMTEEEILNALEGGDSKGLLTALVDQKYLEKEGDSYKIVDDALDRARGISADDFRAAA